MIYDGDGYDTEIQNFPKRRRAMLGLLDSPRTASGYVKYLAFNLVTILERNGHPICAYAIKMRLSGIRVRMTGSKVEIIEQLNIEEIDDGSNR